MDAKCNFTIQHGRDHSEPISEFYHLCSKGTQEDVLFHQRQEFIDGMNIIAFAAAACPVCVLAFCIMDNHFHFILKADTGSTREFAYKISRCYGMKFKNRTSADVIQQTIRWEAYPITDERYLLNSIAYVMNNPVKAGYDKWVTDYPWSGNSLYFRGADEIEKQKAGCRRFVMLPLREMREYIRSSKRIPPDWLITEAGYIWPGSYVDWKMVEQLYENLNRMKYFLNSRKENEETALSITSTHLTLSDEEIRRITMDMAESIFHVVEINQLSIPERIRLARAIIRKTGCRQERLYRILHLKKN